jgi:ankyrin repeat protein
MFPNPQDVLPLPPRPSVEQYKKRAKELVKAAEAGAVRDWIVKWIDSLIELQATPGLQAGPDSWIAPLEHFIQAQQSTSSSLPLTKAQFVIARAHGFESWPKLSQHLAALARSNSSVSVFERAAEAIVNGDLARLESLLRANPELVRQRSTREHRATLLHYVSANGVEGYRQKSPANAVEIARRLLDSGADVNATADVYGTRATTLSLVATSIHPEQAGLQEALMELLIARGGFPDRKLVSACLGNGRLRAAEFLAARGADLDLEGAAGLGKLEIVGQYFGNGELVGASAVEVQRALFWACEYGRNEVVEFLLRQGASLEDQANTGQSALHWAVIGGNVETVRLLIQRGANLHAKNMYGGTALGQASWCEAHAEEKGKFEAVIGVLVEAGGG